MEWLFVLIWPHYLPRRVYEEVREVVETHFRELEDA